MWNPRAHAEKTGDIAVQRSWADFEAALPTQAFVYIQPTSIMAPEALRGTQEGFSESTQLLQHIYASELTKALESLPSVKVTTRKYVPPEDYTRGGAINETGRLIAAVASDPYVQEVAKEVVKTAIAEGLIAGAKVAINHMIAAGRTPGQIKLPVHSPEALAALCQRHASVYYPRLSRGSAVWNAGPSDADYPYERQPLNFAVPTLDGHLLYSVSNCAELISLVYLGPQPQQLERDSWFEMFGLPKT